MKFAVVGAGALGSIYALRLAQVAPVTRVVRELSRAPRRILAERVGASSGGEAHDAPPAALEIPDDVGVVLVAVRVDQLDDALLDRLAKGDAPLRVVVVLTPLLPQLLARVQEKLGDRLVVAMPGIVAYAPDDATPAGELHLRYWTPKSAPTMLEARAQGDPRSSVVNDVAQAFVAAGIPCGVQPHVATINAATTVAFFPLLLAVQASQGSIATLLADGKLLRLALDAGKEARALAKTIGDLASFASLLLSFAGPFTVRAGVKLARMRAPESIVFLEKHFGTKLRAQNSIMRAWIEELATTRGVGIDALRKLAALAIGEEG